MGWLYQFGIILGAYKAASIYFFTLNITAAERKPELNWTSIYLLGVCWSLKLFFSENDEEQQPLFLC